MSVVPGTRLDSSVPIAVLEPLRRVNAALLDLLDGFDAKDWHRPTVHKDRDVKISLRTCCTEACDECRPCAMAISPLARDPFPPQRSSLDSFSKTTEDL